jgi:hypothetical protein
MHVAANNLSLIKTQEITMKKTIKVLIILCNRLPPQIPRQRPTTSDTQLDVIKMSIVQQHNNSPIPIQIIIIIITKIIISQ